MPQYSAPGVYVEEVSSGIKPIVGVSTSTAGFIGLVADDVAMPLQPGRVVTDAAGNSTPGTYSVAPALAAQLVTSWEGFKNSFGDVQAGNRVLALAVYGFFNNGGSRCWITRVPPGAAPAPDTNDQAGGQTAPAADIDSVALATVTTALDTFKVIDEISIVAIPGGVSDGVQNAILDHCENEFLQDRFGVLDGRPGAGPTRAAVAAGTRSSSYGAIYHPWITVYDPSTNSVVPAGPSGHIAGVYARVDAQRGVHKAPANEVIRGAAGVTTLVSREDQAGLNPEDVNVIRLFGADVTIYGARTLKAKEDPEWKYVNVRRLFLFLRDSINTGVQWTVFEPNDTALWGKLRRNLTGFLTNVWLSGALLGATPQDAFYVHCDETLNTADVRAAGQVIVEIGVAVVNPAEFVIFRISQWAGLAAA